jgi:hypothetical protein
MVAKLDTRKSLEEAEAKAGLLGMHPMSVFEVDGNILYPDQHGWTTARVTRTHDTLEDALRYLAACRIAEERSPGYRKGIRKVAKTDQRTIRLDSRSDEVVGFDMVDAPPAYFLRFSSEPS